MEEQTLLRIEELSGQHKWTKLADQHGINEKYEGKGMQKLFSLSDYGIEIEMSPES